MENTQEKPVVSSESSEPRIEDIEQAPIASRFIAALIDYFVLLALAIFLGGFIRHPDLQFLGALIAGVLYFSLGNSRLTSGQTLGKKAFGLRVMRLSPDSSSPYLSVGRALLRYLFSFGLVILFTEIPALLFRTKGLVASPVLLESHMLAVFVYSMCNFSAVLFDPFHRALHDEISESLVVRTSTHPEGAMIARLIERLKALHAKRNFPRFVPALIAGGIIGGILWTMGVSHSEAVSKLSEYRYHFEQQADVRILAIDQVAKRLRLDLLLVAEGKKDPPEKLAQSYTDFLLRSGAVKKAEVSELEYRLYSLPDGSPGQAYSAPKNVLVNTETLVSQQLEQ